MPGPFGGVVAADSEQGVAGEILELLRLPPVAHTDPSEAPDRIVEASGASEVEGELPNVVAAHVIQFRPIDRAIEYDIELSSFRALSLDGDDAGELVFALPAFAERIALLHDEGRAHGDIRPALLGWHGSRPSVLISEAEPDAPALLRARLATGAAPSDVAFVAPEVVAGAPASPASDVYSLAAVVYGVLARRAPLAMIDARDVFGILGEEAADALLGALSANPDERPDARALARALFTGDEPADKNESMIGAVLVAGGAAVVTGILALAVSRFSALGELSKLVIALGITSAIALVGFLSFRRGSERSGIGLLTVAAQLCWADVNLALAVLGLAESHAAWAVAGVGVGLLQASLAARFSSRVMGGFAGVAFVISAVTFGISLPRGSIGAALYAAGVGSVYLVLARFLARRRQDALSTPLTLAAAVATFTSVALSLPALRQHALWSFAWPYLIAALAVLAGARSLGVALALFGPTLQALVLFDEPEGPHLAAVATLLIAWIFGKRWLSEGFRRVGAVTAGVWSVASLLLSIVAISRAPELPALVRHLVTPYLLALGHLAVRRNDHRHAAVVLLSLAPVLQATVFHHSLVPVSLAVVLGLVVLACASRARDREAELAVTIVGLSASALTPGVVTLAARGAWSRVWLLPLAAAGISFVVLSRFRPRQPEHRRLLELGAVLVAGGIPLLCSLPDARSELAYAALTLTSGVVLLGVALWQKRLFLSLASSVLLLSLFAIQYFAKLSQAVHWGLLCLGFGAVLLAFGVLYERKLKAALPKRQGWEW